jgi:hypothetical protein
MAAIGKDYLACTAARSGAGCSNRTSIRRSRVEHVVLEGLKGQLMQPELVEEFIQAFHEEINRRNCEQDLRAGEHQVELARVSKKLAGLYDAIADGLRTPGLQDQLLDLERRQCQLNELVAQAPPPAPRFHPKLAEVYRATVTDLHIALTEPDARTEAAEILRGLIERITVRDDPNGHAVELTGDIVKLLTLPGGSIPVPFNSSVKVVAGVGFEPTTFRVVTGCSSCSIRVCIDWSGWKSTEITMELQAHSGSQFCSGWPATSEQNCEPRLVPLRWQ